MQAPSHGDFSIPSGPNMHAPASPSQRKPSWQSQRISSIRSGRSGHAPSSRHSTLSANQPNATRETSLRRASTAASAQSSQSKWWRVRLFRGMIKDVKRRAPYYWSDWLDAWDYRIIPATVYMYFAKYGFHNPYLESLCVAFPTHRDSNETTAINNTVVIDTVGY